MTERVKVGVEDRKRQRDEGRIKRQRRRIEKLTSKAPTSTVCFVPGKGCYDEGRHADGERGNDFDGDIGHGRSVTEDNQSWGVSALLYCRLSDEAGAALLVVLRA